MATILLQISSEGLFGCLAITISFLNIGQRGRGREGFREDNGREEGKGGISHHVIYHSVWFDCLTVSASTSSWSRTPPGTPHLCCHHWWLETWSHRHTTHAGTQQQQQQQQQHCIHSTASSEWLCFNRFHVVFYLEGIDLMQSRHKIKWQTQLHHKI